MEWRTEKNNASRECSHDGGISTLFHDGIDNWHRHTRQKRREGTHSNIWNVILGVAVSYVVEEEMTVVANEPPGQAEQHLRKWWMHIEVILSLDVIRREFPKVNLVESMQEFASRSSRTELG